jgi:hypothetical protein
MDGNLFDKAKEKAQDLAGKNPDKVNEGVDRAADFADDKSGGKHTDKIQQAADKLKNNPEPNPE